MPLEISTKSQKQNTFIEQFEKLYKTFAEDIHASLGLDSAIEIRERILQNDPLIDNYYRLMFNQSIPRRDYIFIELTVFEQFGQWQDEQRLTHSVLVMHKRDFKEIALPIIKPLVDSNRLLVEIWEMEDLPFRHESKYGVSSYDVDNFMDTLAMNSIDTDEEFDYSESIYQLIEILKRTDVRNEIQFSYFQQPGPKANRESPNDDVKPLLNSILKDTLWENDKNIRYITSRMHLSGMMLNEYLERNA